MQFKVVSEKPDGDRVQHTVEGETIESVIWDVWAKLGFRQERLVSISRPIVLPAKES